MSKISYCSIEEAWGLNEPFQSEEEQQKPQLSFQQEEEQQRLPFKQQEEEQGDIKDKQIKELEETIKYLTQLLENKTKNKIIQENFGNISAKSKVDLFILILLGIFMIYVIDQLFHMNLSGS